MPKVVLLAVVIAFAKSAPGHVKTTVLVFALLVAYVAAVVVTLNFFDLSGHNHSKSQHCV